MSIRRDKIQLEVEINGQKAGQSYRELINDSRNLKRELLALTPGTDAFVKKSAELRKVNDRLGEIRRQTRGVRTESNSVISVLKKFSPALAAAFVIRSAKRFFDFISAQTSGLDLLKNKFTTVFGDAAILVEESANKQAIALGLTRNEYKKLTAQAGDLLIPMGFQRVEAAKLSTEMISLSGALSAWTGGQKTSTEVSDILSKALLGEREQLKTLGISIQENDVKQRLAAKGMSKLTGTALQQAKAMATLELITEKSGDAQESFRKNGEGLIQTKARIIAKINEAAGRMAALFLPAFEKGVVVVEKLLTTLFALGVGLTKIPAFLKENRVQLIAFTVAVISFNSQAIIANAQLLLLSANLLRKAAAAKATAIATAVMTASQKGLTAAMRANPIGLIITALALLAAGLELAYRRSETFRAVVDGLGSLAKETFKIISEAAGSFAKGFQLIKSGEILNGLKEIGTGLKKSNPVSIAFTEGKRLKQAFSNGFDASKEKSLLAGQAAAINESSGELVKAGSDAGILAGQAITDGINSRLKKLSLATPDKDKSKKKSTSKQDLALKALKAQAKKELQELEILNKQKKSTEAEYQAATLKSKKDNFQKQLDLLVQFGQTNSDTYRETYINLLEVDDQIAQQSLEKRIAGIKDIQDTEIQELKLSREQQRITEQAYDEQVLESRRTFLTQKLEILRAGDQQETSLYREAQIELASVQREITDQKVTAQLEAIKTASSHELTELQQKFLNRLLTEQEYEEQALLNKQSELERKAELLQKYGLQETEAFAKNQADQLKVQQDIDGKKLENSKRTEDLKNQLQQASKALATDTLNFAIQILGQDEAARKKHSNAIKAIEIAKIAGNLGFEIAGIWKNAPEGGLIAGPIIAGVQTAAAVIRAAKNTATVAKQKFYHGGYASAGYTGHHAIYHDGLDGVVNADLHVGEYVNPKWQVRHPVFGKVINWMDTYRRNPSQIIQPLKFMSGGYAPDTTPSGLSGISINTTGASSSQAQAVGPLLSKIDQLITVLATTVGNSDTGSNTINQSESQNVDKLVRALSKPIKAYVVHSEFQATASEIADIENQASY